MGLAGRCVGEEADEPIAARLELCGEVGMVAGFDPYQPANRPSRRGSGATRLHRLDEIKGRRAGCELHHNDFVRLSSMIHDSNGMHSRTNRLGYCELKVAHRDRSTGLRL